MDRNQESLDQNDHSISDEQYASNQDYELQEQVSEYSNDDKNEDEGCQRNFDDFLGNNNQNQQQQINRIQNKRFEEYFSSYNQTSSDLDENIQKHSLKCQEKENMSQAQEQLLKLQLEELNQNENENDQLIEFDEEEQLKEFNQNFMNLYKQSLESYKLKLQKEKVQIKEIQLKETQQIIQQQKETLIQQEKELNLKLQKINDVKQQQKQKMQCTPQIEIDQLFKLMQRKV
ncbi:UNKNOWN [Stylonychia lemnae]|uniref:Uncharacterized protein n=1 Tax=Stylonychia lemnae TaxID=5949 RepID=A0A077ZRT4_STYLE|nr:UNKNOWN [Stylonychia lemnae]|eukprot:CDW72060.1 UNKNOWN [Stylonychia lemnae]